MDGQNNSDAQSGDAADHGGGSPSLARAAKKRRRSDESSTSGNDATNCPGVDDTEVTSLPPEMWANVMKYLPFDNILSCCVVSRGMLHETMPLLTKIQIDKAGQMNLAVASRFRDVTDIHINSLLIKEFHPAQGIWDEDFSEVKFDFESRIRVLPFLFCFVRTLERVHFGAIDNSGRVVDGFSPVNECFWEESEMGYPYESPWDLMMAFIDSLSGAFVCGAFPQHLNISGLCCPASNGSSYSRNRACTTCQRACKSFPLESVAAFHSRGSSMGYARAGRAFGLDVCLEMAQVESIVESRPGGKELLLSDERLFRLLGSGRRWEIGDDDIGKLVIVKYEKTLLDEMKRVIAYAGLDAKKLPADKLHAAIAMSFQKGNSLVHKTQRYLLEESLRCLKDEIDLCIDAEDICGSTLELLPCAKSIVHVLVQYFDEDAIHNRSETCFEYDGILEECYTLIRRFLELEKDTPINDDMNNAIPCLAKALEEFDEIEIEAASSLQMIYSRGSEEQRKMIIDAKVISKFVGLLDISDEGVAKVVLSGLADILADEKKEHIDELVRAKGVPVLVTMLVAKDDSIVKDSLSLLVTVGNDHIWELIDTRAHEDLFLIIASEAHIESLPQCSILLRKMSEVKPLAFPTGAKARAHERFKQACISNLRKLVEVLSRTEDEVAQTNLAFVCIALASEANGDNIESLMCDTGLLPLLVELQDSSLGDVAEAAICCLEHIGKIQNVFATKSGETLAWGEYRMLELVDSDEDESSVSCEEALEVSDEELALEVQQAEVECSATSNKEKDSLILSLYQKMQKSCDNEIMEIVCDQTEVDGVSVIYLDALHSLAANILTRMNRNGPAVSFRLRGDTADYLFELLQGYMIKRLENALLMAMHDQRTEVQQQDFFLLPSQEMQSKCNVGNKYHRIEGFSLACSCSLPSSNGIVWCWPENDCRDVLQPGAGRRIIRRLAYKAGIVEMTSDLLELAEAELRHTLGILLVEAYESSVNMTKSVRFLDPKQELTYGSCAAPMDMFYTPPPPTNASPSHEHSNEDHRKQPVYTIVPGQISAAAEKRGIGPSKVYSHYFTVSSPSADEEMVAEKEYYYEDGYFEDSEPKHSTVDCMCMFECNCNVMDIIDDPREASEEHAGGEAAAVEVEEGVDVKSKDIDLIMRVTGYSRVNAVEALKENGNDKRKVFNEYVARQLDATNRAHLGPCA